MFSAAQRFRGANHGDAAVAGAAEFEQPGEGGVVLMIGHDLKPRRKQQVADVHAYRCVHLELKFHF